MNRRLALKLMATIALGSMAVAVGGQALAAQGKPKVIGYYMDASDDFYKAGFEVFKTLAQREGWTVQDVVGQGTRRSSSQRSRTSSRRAWTRFSSFRTRRRRPRRP